MSIAVIPVIPRLYILPFKLYAAVSYHERMKNGHKPKHKNQERNSRAERAGGGYELVRIVIEPKEFQKY